MIAWTIALAALLLNSVLATTNNGAARLLPNGETANRALRLALRGTTSNRDAVGSRVMVRLVDGTRQTFMVKTNRMPFGVQPVRSPTGPQ